MNKERVFLLATAVALILSSCSNDDELQVDNEKGAAIEFRTIDEEKTTTRAAVTDKGNLLSFTVTGYWTPTTNTTTQADYLFNGFGITRGEGSVNWTYSPVMYFPTGGKTDFYAYSPSSSVNLITGLTDYKGASGHDLITYKVPQIGEKNAQEDFLVAKVKDVTTGTVTLNFHHALSRVKFHAKTTSKDMTYLVDKIELVNLKYQASLDLNDARLVESGSLNYATQLQPWKNHVDTKVNYTADMGKSPIQLVYNEFSSLLGETNAILVMPQTTTLLTAAEPTDVNKEFAIKVAYKAYAGDIYYAGSETESEVRYFPVKDLRDSDEPITFEMGRQYSFYLTFGDDAGKEIVFDATVQSWDNAGA